jgi:hypothetical protein
LFLAASAEGVSILSLVYEGWRGGCFGSVNVFIYLYVSRENALLGRSAEVTENTPICSEKCTTTLFG